MTRTEFLITEVVASLSHEKGLGLIMGAPNIVRGGSHSGNIAVHELADCSKIVIGKRADILQFNVVNSMLIINKVWAQGERVF